MLLIVLMFLCACKVLLPTLSAYVFPMLSGTCDKLERACERQRKLIYMVQLCRLLPLTSLGMNLGRTPQASSVSCKILFTGAYTRTLLS